MKTNTDFPFRVDIWGDTGDSGLLLCPPRLGSGAADCPNIIEKSLT